MKKLLIATVLALGLPAVAYAQSDDVKTLIHQEETLDNICRGNSGDDPNTIKACDVRDSIDKKLKTKGWCWGPDNAPGYQKHWVKCKVKKTATHQ